MSCNWSKKFEPFVRGLVKEVKNPSSSLTEEQALEKLINYFGAQDGEIIYKTYFVDGGQISSFTEYEKVQEMRRRFTGEQGDDEISVRANYVGDFRGYARMITAFKKRIISSSVYDIKTGNFINAEEKEKNGITTLNRKLFEYKVELINDLLKSLDKPPISIDIESDTAATELTKYINLVKSAYEARSLSVNENWDSYVILTNFNKLLEEQTPFITISDDFKDSGNHIINMYKYDGPKAQLRQTWSKEDEIPSAETQYSGLAKILLSCLPEVTDDNREIENTAIEASGFASVMATLRSAVLYSTDSNLALARTEYMKGAEGDVSVIISAFSNYLCDSDSFKKPYYTYLRGKLNGIKKYIYDGNMQEDIKMMFTRMFMETVPLSYMQYGYFGKEYKGATIKERWIMNQNYQVQKILNGRISNFRLNPKSWSVVKNRYKIDFDQNYNSQAGDISVTVKNADNDDITLWFHYIWDKNRRLSITPKNDVTRNFTDEGVLTDLIYDITGYLLTPEYVSYMKSRHPSKHELLDDFAPAIGLVIMASDMNHTNNPIAQGGYISSETNGINFSRLGLYNALGEISTIDSLIKGSETNNTVHDVNGNNLPTRGITSLAYQLRELYDAYARIPKGFSPAHYNLAYLNLQLLAEPIIREGVTIEGKGKKARQLLESELYECTIAYDFLEHLMGDGIIYLQNDTFADKGKHFLWGWNLNESFNTEDSELGKFDLAYNLKHIVTGVDRDVARQNLFNLYKGIRRNHYELISDQIVEKYNKAYGTNYSTLEEVDKYLVDNDIKYTDVKAKFEKLGLFTDEYDAIAVKKDKNDDNPNARINETLLNMVKTFVTAQDDERAKQRINRSKRRFLIDLIDSGFTLNRYSSKGGSLVFTRLNTGSNSSWINTRSGNVILGKVTDADGNPIEINRHNVDLLIDPKYTVELNPILESYFFADVLLSNELSTFMTGETFVHAKKGNEGDPNKVEYDESEYEEFSEATRLIAKIKRNVIPGASMHTFLPGMKYGVAENIRLSVMEDIPGNVWNMFGIRDVVDSSDGSGFSNIYEAMAERTSLLDAATGLDMKTIGWDVDPETFIPKMLKWAVYATTNERRRHGADSEASWEDLHKKLNSDEIRWVDIVKYYRKAIDNGNFFIFNNETGKTYKIVGIDSIVSGDKRYFYKKAIEVNKDGVLLPDAKETALDKNNNEIERDSFGALIIPNIEASLGLNTVYDIDVFFGGAYNKKLNEKGKLVWNDFNNRVTFDIICSEKLKNKIIAYAVNKSAFKVGYGNVNAKESWFNPNAKLKTIWMSTRHIGLQMNAEHDLLDAEVTEMTQMISALAENWYSGEIVKQIYKDIGAVVDESLRKINAEIQANDMDALRIRLGKALIDAFKTKEETIGLAQAFLAKAEVAMAEANASVKIPFSAATINSTFISTIVSMLNKKGIRRKYAGIAAVLTPSYNMMQYYRYDGKTKLHSNVSEDIREFKRNNPNFSKTVIRDFIRNRIIIDDNGIEYENPFLETIINPNEIQQEDTLFVFDPTTEKWDKIKINSYEKYNTWVNRSWKEGTVVKRLKIAPRDLMGADTKFTINDEKSEFNGQRFSIYNLISVQASHGDVDAWNAILQDKHWLSEYVYNPEGDVNIKLTLKNIIQHQLKDLEQGFIWDPKFGSKKIKVSDVEVSAAEVIMGRLNADKFGLEEGDQIQDILDQGSDFFYNRWKSNYGTLTGVPEELYDIVLYTKNGPILIKIGDKVDQRLTRNRKIEILDDKYILNGAVFCSAEGKKKFTYLADNNNEYNVIVVNSKEALDDLLDSDTVDTYKVNLTPENLVPIGKYFDPNGERVIEGDWQKTWGQFRDYFRDTFETQQQKLAEQRFEAFKQSLNLVGARIPTQAMQSFMPLKVIAFTDDLTNVVYVPRMQTWLEGSDYDIDKLYILAHSIASNGTLPTLSGLSRDFSPAETLRLPAPDGRHFVEKEGGYRVSLAELNQVTQMLGGAMLGGGLAQQSLFNPEQLLYTGKYRLDVFRKILEKDGRTRISFEFPDLKHLPFPTSGLGAEEFKELVTDISWNQAEVYNEAKKKFIDLLNKHSQSKFKLNREEALRNNVTYGIFDATTKPVNQINAHAPIEMDEVSDAASKTAMSRMEKHVSSDIPSTKFKVQVQAGVGKDVTGISAVSVKVFFAETTYFNDVLTDVIANLKVKTNRQIAINILEKLVMYNPIYNTPALVANANIKRIIESLGDLKVLENVNADPKGLLGRWNDGLNFNIYECLKYFDNQTSVIDAALSESGLLSSATDNMKHLYLPKLNATAQFVDMYTTMLTHGVKLQDIANILTSPLFTAVSKLCQYNIFRNETQGYSVDRALGFYLNEDTLPHVSKTLLAQAFSLVGINVNAKDVLPLLAYDYVQNTGDTDAKRNKLIKDLLDKIYELRNNRFSGGDGDFFDEYFAGYDNEWIEDGESTRINWSNASLQAINTVINFLEECIIRNNTIHEVNRKVLQPEYAQYKDAQYQLDRLKIVKDYIVPKTEEQRIFGQMLGINQGIRTDAYSIYSLVRRIENHINGRMEQKQKKGDIEKFEPFKLYLFLNPDPIYDSYRTEWIENYDKIKSSFNILHAIKRVPHFSKMFEVLYTNNWILSNFSAKYDIVNAVAREIEKRNPYFSQRNFDRVLNEKEYKQVEQYVNDVLIIGWLSKQDFKYLLSTGNKLYSVSSDTDKAEGPVQKGLKDQHDFATFKYWMEHTLIPNLQEDPEFKSNFFIKSLEYVSDENRITKRVEHHYRLPINMMTIEDSVKTQAIYDGYLRAFDEIQHKTKDGIKVADLFFLYNLIVNKDGYGQDSFTRIFENLVSQKNSTSLIESFYDYVSQIDANIDGRKTIINTITRPEIITDVENRISTYVKGSKVKGSSRSITSINSDYTFGAPNLSRNWKIVKDDIFIESPNPTTSLVNLKIDSQTIRMGILSYLEDTLGKDKVQSHTSTWFEENFPDDPLVAKASAFIDNGVLYIRSDSSNNIAATVHEIAHYLLAGMRFNSNKEIRDLYFDILSKIEPEEYKSLLGEDLITEYEAFRTPIDIKEEIFAKMVEMYFAKNVLPKLQISEEIQTATTKFNEIFNEMFGSAINSELFFGAMKQISTNSDIFAYFAQNIFALDWMEDTQQSIILSQKVADLRNKLKRVNRLEETDCI